MPDTFKSIQLTQPNPDGPYVQQLVGAVSSSSGDDDSGKLVALNDSGQIDSSLISSDDPSVSANIFHTGQVVNVGTTGIWTPASGNSFRLLGYIVEVTPNASQMNGGVITVTLEDGSTSMPFAHDIFIPSTALKTYTCYRSGWIDLGSVGYLSIAANNVLGVKLTAALVTGNVRVLLSGVEES
jgi:hypothetical protein